MRVKTYAIVFNAGEPDELRIDGTVSEVENPEMSDEMALNQALGELRYSFDLMKPPYGEMRPRVLGWTGDAPAELSNEAADDGT